MSSPLPPSSGRPPSVPRPPVSRPPVSRPPIVAPASRVPAARRSSGLRVADRRGLTGLGAAVLLLAFAGGGAAYDVLTGSGLDLGFTLGFLAGCVLVALLVHREDLLAVVVMPPLVYATVAFLAGVLDPASGSGGFLVRQGIAVLNELVLDAPILFAGTGAAALLAVLRWLGSRS